MRNLRPADFEATHYPAVVKLSGEECPSCAPFPERHLFCAFCLCQSWLTAFVTLTSQVRSLASSKTSAAAKNLMPLGGGLPSGLSRRAPTRIGISCGWQFNTHAACSAEVFGAGQQVVQCLRIFGWLHLSATINKRAKRPSE